MSNLQLNSKSLNCDFDRDTGALIKLSAAETGWDILNRPALGLSFRLLVPLSEEKRNNNVFGEQQKLSSCDASEDRIVFHWDGVESERGGFLPIHVTLDVTVEDRQIVYKMNIENKSDYTVEAVYCPYIGDIRPPKDANWLKCFQFVYAQARETDIWPEFENQFGYYGVDYPTQFSEGSNCAPMGPFTFIRSENQGLYAGIKTASAELVTWGAELRPGWDSSINRMVPKNCEIAEKPVHIRFAAVQLPYIQPGESRCLTDIALEAFTGGWQDGVDIYKQWRNTWMRISEPPVWAKNPHSWQQLHINSPEDELRMCFTELPKVAEVCKKHGVAAIQLVGWNDGGQDQGNPCHNPDPRLGTYEELREAIAKCHEIGVKVILFSKFTWADAATDWFRKELKELAITDPYGDYYLYSGYRYQTVTQLLDINTKRLIPMCFLSDGYLKVCETEFNKLVGLGAAGMLYDESQHHAHALLCFNMNHGHRYAAPVYQNDRELINRLKKLPGTPNDFLIAGEACYDWEFEEYQLSYLRSESKNYLPINRYMLPHAQIMTAITGFNDRNMLNQCLMLRYVVSYEPYNFKGCLDDYPETMEYGKKMDMLRTEYRKWFWDGEFQDTCGASVTCSCGGAHRSYSVFRAEDESLGAVICNYEDEPVCVSIKADNGYTFNRYRFVDSEGFADYNGSIEIPARSAVIVL